MPETAPERITQREAIARAVLGRLRAALAPIPVERNRDETVHAEEAPLVNFWDAGHTAERPDTGETSYQMELPIEAAVTAETRAAIGTEMNALYGRVLDALMGEPTLGGLCVQLIEGTFDPRPSPVAESQTPLGSFSLSVMAEFRSLDGSPVPFVDANRPVPGTPTDPGAGAGSPAVGSKYRHVQHDAATVWTIRHNLGHYPNSVIVDTLGREIEPGGKNHADENTLVLGFGVPTAGTADLD